MTTLFDLVLGTARKLNITRQGTATGGSTTTTVDNVGRAEDDDSWNGGTLFIPKTTDNQAPRGQYARITDYVSTTYTVTHTSLTAAVGAGDTYVLAKSRYPLDVIVEKVNVAISEAGPYPLNNTGLTTAENQTEYELPSYGDPSVQIMPDYVREVYIQLNKDTDDNRWMKINNWFTKKDGTTGYLILPVLDPGYTIRLVYVAEHTPLYAYSDTLDDSIHPERIMNSAAQLCLLWRKMKGVSGLEADINAFTDKVEQDKVMHPVVLPHKGARLLTL